MCKVIVFSRQLQRGANAKCLSARMTKASFTQQVSMPNSDLMPISDLKRPTMTYSETDIASDMSSVKVSVTKLIRDYRCDARDVTPSTMY